MVEITVFRLNRIAVSPPCRADTVRLQNGRKPYRIGYRIPKGRYGDTVPLIGGAEVAPHEGQPYRQSRLWKAFRRKSAAAGSLAKGKRNGIS